MSPVHWPWTSSPLFLLVTCSSLASSPIFLSGSDLWCHLLVGLLGNGVMSLHPILSRCLWVHLQGHLPIQCDQGAETQCFASGSSDIYNLNLHMLRKRRSKVELFSSHSAPLISKPVPTNLYSSFQAMIILPDGLCFQVVHRCPVLAYFPELIIWMNFCIWVCSCIAEDSWESLWIL